MDANDPFSTHEEGDHTVIRPNPRVRRATKPSSPSALLDRSTEVGSTSPRGEVSANYLINNAALLLTLAGQIRVTSRSPNVEALREFMVTQVKEFNEASRNKGNHIDFVPAARYALCSLLDETILNTPWGADSDWSRKSLLVTFHNEAWGGEKFFQILERALKEPARNIDLLEFLFVCLAFGFEGKYRVTKTGLSDLTRLRDNLFETVRMHRATPERDLSPHWRGKQDRRNPLIRYVPLWMVGSLVALILASTFFAFRFSLGEIADPLYSGLNAIGRNQIVGQFVPPSIDRPGLSALLKTEIKRGLVDVFTKDGSDVVRICVDNLFPSGSASVDKQHLPLLVRIAEVLRNYPGQILVSGHTDNVPIRSLQFQSNWELSQARAKHVARVIADRLGSAARLKAEGRADTEALAPNDSVQNRARNRRVEVSVLPPVKAVENPS